MQDIVFVDCSWLKVTFIEDELENSLYCAQFTSVNTS